MNDVFTLLYLIEEKKGFARNNWHIKEVGELSSNALHITTALKEFHHLRISFHINFQKYLKFLPKCRMVLDLPTCRAPLTKSGFLRGLSFHSSKAWSMLLDKYLSISLRLNDYMAAKILIINEICNYFMLTLLKDRVINGCFVIKDRVMKGCFMTKDRVIMGYL